MTTRGVDAYLGEDGDVGPSVRRIGRSKCLVISRAARTARIASSSCACGGQMPWLATVGHRGTVVLEDPYRRCRRTIVDR